MKNIDLEETCKFTCLHAAEKTPITGIFTGDLLSWAMANLQEGDVWFTVMGNLNTIAVATLADCACVVLCHGVQPDADALSRAVQQGVSLYTTTLPEFEASLSLAKALKL